MKSNHIIIFTLLCLISLSACRFNPNVQGKGADLLQGKWKEVHQTYQDSLIQYTASNFKFSCDSFYVELDTRSTANYYGDHCFNSGRWKEYAKGNYVVSNDTLYLIGTFTKSNFKQKLDGCYRIGQYLPTYLIKETGEKRIELINIQEGYPLSIELQERIICKPKPL